MMLLLPLVAPESDEGGWEKVGLRKGSSNFSLWVSAALQRLYKAETSTTNWPCSSV